MGGYGQEGRFSGSQGSQQLRPGSGGGTSRRLDGLLHPDSGWGELLDAGEDYP